MKWLIHLKGMRNEFKQKHSRGAPKYDNTPPHTRRHKQTNRILRIIQILIAAALFCSCWTIRAK